MKNMTRKNKNGKILIPLNIQFFAEPPADPPEDKEVSFDDFLKEEGNKTEFDTRVQKAIEEALKDAKKDWESKTDDKLSEAEKLAKMNKEEKAQYLQQKKEKEISEREAAVTKKELMAEAKNTLTEKKLPLGLAEVLNYTDAESCNKSIETVEKAFRSAVEEAVNERLKGGPAIKKAEQEKEELGGSGFLDVIIKNQSKR